MAYVEYRITGTTPLLMNSPESMGRASEGANIKRIPSPEEEAAGKVYKLPTEQLYMPTIAFRSSMLAACVGRRIGKMGAKSVLSGAVFLTSDIAPLVNPENGEPITKYEIDVRRCVVQGKGVHRARPRIDSWGTQLTFEYDEDILANESVVTELMALAGKIKGVGDYRPQKSGPYGRFEVEKIS